ncbi:hypothetical protein LX32DRAFT_27077 [Colletotrichum zoysiae]|uniref:Uncharacterized protein n=1 Tax=Colletotrichum zoysiae TaxID=1216348 RepID=A0AAD9HTF1_9PEZI|nr:hypothetical protein LX32DRAFT_27077 [Colletotrichum zoysiae]
MRCILGPAALHCTAPHPAGCIRNHEGINPSVQPATSVTHPFSTTHPDWLRLQAGRKDACRSQKPKAWDKCSCLEAAIPLVVLFHG